MVFFLSFYLKDPKKHLEASNKMVSHPQLSAQSFSFLSTSGIDLNVYFKWFCVFISCPRWQANMEQSEVGWSHHHGRSGGHQIGPLPVVPLDAVVACCAGQAWVVDAIEVGRTTCFKPPACTEGPQSESSRYGRERGGEENLELIEFELMKCNTQMRRVAAPPEASWAHLQVQWSLSLSLVLNGVPVWERLLVLPAVPLKCLA